MNNVIPHTEFLPANGEWEKNYLKFKGGITLHRSVSPFKLKYLPFHRELSIQTAKLIKKETKKSFENQYDFIFHAKALIVEKEPYVYRTIIESPINPKYTRYIDNVSNVYRGMYDKVHSDGWAYGYITAYNKRGFSDSEKIFIRWKSNLQRHEYIEPDDELDLTQNDISFEICKELPDDVAMHFFSTQAKDVDCNNWIKFINDDSHYPRKRIKRENDFICEILECRSYPDVSFTLYFDRDISEDFKDVVLSEFEEFQYDWDMKHINCIHDIMPMDDVEDCCDSNVLKIHVDFGNCSPKVIDKLIKWLKSSDLQITKIIVN